MDPRGLLLHSFRGVFLGRDFGGHQYETPTNGKIQKGSDVSKSPATDPTIAGGTSFVFKDFLGHEKIRVCLY